jgi:hypothetical protein
LEKSPSKTFQVPVRPALPPRSPTSWAIKISKCCIRYSIASEKSSFDWYAEVPVCSAIPARSPTQTVFFAVLHPRRAGFSSIMPRAPRCSLTRARTPSCRCICSTSTGRQERFTRARHRQQRGHRRSCVCVCACVCHCVCTLLHPPAILALAPDALVLADAPRPALLASAPLALCGQRPRWCGQRPVPPHSLQLLLWRWCGQTLRGFFCAAPPTASASSRRRRLPAHSRTHPPAPTPTPSLPGAHLGCEHGGGACDWVRSCAEGVQGRAGVTCEGLYHTVPQPARTRTHARTHPHPHPHPRYPARIWGVSMAGARVPAPPHSLQFLLWRWCGQTLRGFFCAAHPTASASSRRRLLPYVRLFAPPPAAPPSALRDPISTACSSRVHGFRLPCRQPSAFGLHPKTAFKNNEGVQIIYLFLLKQTTCHWQA